VDLTQTSSYFKLRCSACPSCCRTVRVPLTDADLGRLVVTTQLHAEKVIDWLAPTDIDMSGEPESFVETNVGRRIVMLRHENDACMFLSDGGYCNVYASRPAACASYPLALVNRNGSPVLEPLPDAPCVLAQRDFQSVGICDSALGAAQRVEAELSNYWVKISAWNLRQRRRKLLGHMPRRSSSFLQFLGF